jgi:hypothetical protein
LAAEAISISQSVQSPLDMSKILHAQFDRVV